MNFEIVNQTIHTRENIETFIFISFDSADCTDSTEGITNPSDFLFLFLLFGLLF